MDGHKLEPTPLRIKLRIQPTLVTGHLAEDNGNFVFVLCRRGVQQMLGQKLKVGSQYVVEIKGRILESSQ